MKLAKRDAERVYAVGIDPGHGTTAMVLTKDDVPIAAVAVQGPVAAFAPVELRSRMIATFCLDHIQGWVQVHEIEDLFVNLELPFLNTDMPHGVKTLMSQMTLHGALACRLYDLQDVFVHYASVNNQTVKAMFTGDGSASKMDIISCSAWRKRPDVDSREHIADAQAIATTYPETALLTDEQAKILRPCYIDGKVGKGPQWKNKWPKGGRAKLWRQQ